MIFAALTRTARRLLGIDLGRREDWRRLYRAAVTNLRVG